MAEGLQRPEGVNISKGQVRAEGMEQSHVAAENIREHQRMLRMKFYVTANITLQHKLFYPMDKFGFMMELIQKEI